LASPRLPFLPARQDSRLSRWEGRFVVELYSNGFLLILAERVESEPRHCSRVFLPMPSPVLKRSIVLGGRKTSVSLEDEFWSALKEIAAQRRMGVSDLIADVGRDRQGNLSSCLRIFVLNFVREQANMTGRRCKVLVVDDEPMTLEVTAGMLADLGCEVITARDGNEALGRLNDVSILITDINMPGLNGYELAERARRMHPAVRVVLISGLPTEGRGLPLLRKPLRESELARVVEQTISGSGATSAR
jgi:two-component system, cell cycle response regulator CpdR